VQGLDSLTQEEVDHLGRLYVEALDVDYDAISRHQDRLIGAMKGKTLRISTPLGTDLRVPVAETSWFHKNDGRMDRERAALARGVRDREMELPAGALRFIPDIDSVEGKLVVPRWAGGEEVTFQFRAGRVRAVNARVGQDKVLQAWEAATGDKDRIGEMVLGTNPKLPGRGPGRMPPYYGYGAGVLRIALGDNWESGGTNRSSLEAWFYFSDTTIAAGDVNLVEQGHLVLP
jgi:leucyl aminopeptidase (aminopeptidase T)